MAVLAENEIIMLAEKDEEFISPFFEQNVQPASYDLKLGKVIKAGEKIIDNEKMQVSLEPNNWAFVKSKETVKLPNNICGRYGIVSSIARQGIVHFGGPQIDPGYNGCLFTSIFNPTLDVVVIDIDSDFFTIEFSELTSESSGYKGTHQGLRDFPSTELQRMMNMQTKDLAHVIKTVDSLEVGMMSLQSDVQAIRKTVVESAGTFQRTGRIFDRIDSTINFLKRFKYIVGVLLIMWATGLLERFIDSTLDKWLNPILEKIF